MGAQPSSSQSAAGPARWFAGLAFLLPLWLVSCAKTGDPHPPEVLVPRPATNLAAIEYGDEILLTVSMPTTNTNGSAVTTLREIRLLRLAEKDRLETKPIPEAEFLKSAEPVLVIPSDRVSDYLSNQTLILHDTLSNMDRSAVYGASFRYAVRFVNKKKQSAGLSNQAFIAPVPIPSPPFNLKLEVSQQMIRLLWESPSQNLDGSKPARILGYNVYRSEDPKKFPPGPINSSPVQSRMFEDRTFKFDKTYYYAVSILASRENPYAETKASTAVDIIPRDTFPPGIPQNLNGVVTDGVVLLLWASPPDDDVVGYRILRAISGDERSLPVQPGLIPTLSYRDDKVEPGKKYTYRVLAVDSHGNEGIPAEVEVDVR